MKDLILIGIDFSDTSKNAVQYGIGLANKMNADIMLVWVDTQNDKNSDAELRHQERHECRQALKTLCKNISDKHPLLKTNYKLRKGMVHRELAYTAKETEASLMVIGTDGINGIEEFRIENNTFRIIAQAPCPVISVHKDFVVNNRFEQFMLPIDEMKNTLDKLPLSIELAKKLGAKIRLLNIYQPNIESLSHQTNLNSTKATKILDEQQMLGDISIRLHSSDPKAIVEQAIKQNTDMLIIMTNPVMSRAEIPEGVLAQKVIHCSPIPILSVQAKQL